MRSKHTATLLLTTTLLVTTVGVLPSSGHAAAAPQPVCDRAFDVIGTPPINPPGANHLFAPDLSVVSRDAVWFGFDQYGAGDGSANASNRPWPMRWDGDAVESAPPVPRPHTAAGRTFWFSDTAALLGGPQTVSFDSAEHGWLLTNVSALGNPNSSGAPVGYRWHEGRWTMTPLAVSPNPRLHVPDPADVASLSPNDAWLVGSVWRPFLDGEAGYHGALIQHWDGTSWQIVDNPLSNERHVSLWAVGAVSATDIWAVGGRYNFDDPIEPVVMHWDGSEWSLVDTPAPAGSILHDVSVTGSGDVWAVGTRHHDDGQLDPVPLIMRWDGDGWTVVEGLPELPGTFDVGGGNTPPSIYAASTTDVWVAVNFRVDHVPNNYAQNLRAVFLHWDGSTWRTVATPGPEQYGTGHTVDGIAGTGPDNIWIVGRSWGRSQVMGPVVYRLSCDRPGGGSR